MPHACVVQPGVSTNASFDSPTAGGTRPHSAVPTLTESEWQELRALRKLAGKRKRDKPRPPLTVNDKPRTGIEGRREIRELRELLALRFNAPPRTHRVRQGPKSLGRWRTSGSKSRVRRTKT